MSLNPTAESRPNSHKFALKPAWMARTLSGPPWQAKSRRGQPFQLASCLQESHSGHRSGAKWGMSVQINAGGTAGGKIST